MTTHLRLNGVYWGLTALCTMRHQDALPRDEMVEFVMQCWDDEAGVPCIHCDRSELLMNIHELGAFGSYPGHDAHILSTLSGT